MKARPHVIFFRSQHTVKLDLPNDVFYDLMALSKQVNLLIGCFCPSPQKRGLRLFQNKPLLAQWSYCLLYTSDAADDLLCVDLGGRRIIKKKKQNNAI